jgi:hypothetical protein
VVALLAETVARAANCSLVSPSHVQSVSLHEYRYFSRKSQVTETIFDELKQDYKTLNTTCSDIMMFRAIVAIIRRCKLTENFVVELSWVTLLG